MLKAKLTDLSFFFFFFIKFMSKQNAIDQHDVNFSPFSGVVSKL